MYHEILRLLETDNKSNNSKGSIHTSTTISSFTSSKETNIKKPRRFMSIHDQPNNTVADNQLKSYEFKLVFFLLIRSLILFIILIIFYRQINHRFSRLETHVITLAKTVAHISSEVQSIKSIEEELYNIRKDVNDLKYINNNNNPNHLFSNTPNPTIQSARSVSEPNFVNNIITNNLSNNNNNNNNNTIFTPTSNMNSNLNLQHLNSPQSNHDLFNTKDKMRLLVPSITNPRRLRKLTKYVNNFRKIEGNLKL